MQLLDKIKFYLNCISDQGNTYMTFQIKSYRRNRPHKERTDDE